MFILGKHLPSSMKKIEVYLQSGKLEQIVEVIEQAGQKGLTVFYARGRGDAERSKVHGQRGVKMQESMFNMVDCIVAVVEDKLVDSIVTKIKKHVGDGSKGLVIISSIDDAVKL
ncbi:MAG: P-II family nitrogen regulator [Candidatus Nitrosotenuis sp.]|nr:MAG: P-II family nitrogen regulator [Candidatus Nitrosotenuis sp.]